MKILRYISEVFFPTTCINCGASIDIEDLFCASCTLNTVFTNYLSATENEIIDRLISIPELKNAFAPLYYKKDAPIKQMFYKIKYGDRPDIAKKIASYTVERWTNCTQHPLSLDGVCYVPIHKTKLSKRGYNQSEIIAREISEHLKIPLLHLLERRINIETQTHFGRSDRLKNQEGTISVIHDITKFNHLLIVDDILTTGATIEVCCDSLRKKNNKCSFSVMTLAITDNW